MKPPLKPGSGQQAIEDEDHRRASLTAWNRMPKASAPTNPQKDRKEKS